MLQSERPVNRLFAFGGNWISRRQYRTVRDVIDSYQRVTCEDITAVMEKYPLAEQTTVAVGPLQGEEQIQALGKGQALG